MIRGVLIPPALSKRYLRKIPTTNLLMPGGYLTISGFLLFASCAAIPLQRASWAGTWSQAGRRGGQAWTHMRAGVGEGRANGLRGSRIYLLWTPCLPWAPVCRGRRVWALGWGEAALTDGGELGAGPLCSGDEGCGGGQGPL
jgi:hypothetical protein